MMAACFLRASSLSSLLSTLNADRDLLRDHQHPGQAVQRHHARYMPPLASLHKAFLAGVSMCWCCVPTALVEPLARLRHK